MRIHTRQSRLAGLVAAVTTAFVGTASAEPWGIVGPRYMGMGGAAVAVADDSLATYWNPAAYGFAEGWEVRLPATANYSIENRALEQLGELFVAADQASSSIAAVEAGVASLSAQDIEDVLGVLALIPELGRSGQLLLADVNLGLSGHAGRFGFSVLSYTNGGIQPINESELSLGLGINGVAPLAAALGGTTPTSTPAGVTLASQIASAHPEWAAAAGALVAVAEQAGFDPSDPADVEFLADLAASTVAGNGLGLTGTLGATVQGLSTQEFGIAYGYPLPMPFFEPLDRKISIGGGLKYMLGISYASFVDYNDGDLQDAVGGLASLDNTRISHNVGVDLGMLVQPTDWLRVGFVARNVNSPKFDAALISGRDFELDPQVRLGAAVMPLPHWILSSDFDLTENDSLAFRNYKSRMIALGTEYTIPIGWFALALRLGTNFNIAENQNNDAMMTGGLGFYFGDFFLDLAAGGTFNKEDFATDADSTTSLPTRLQVGLNLAWQSRPPGTRRDTGRWTMAQRP